MVIGSEGDITNSQFNNVKSRLRLENLVSYEGKKYGMEKHLAFLDADIFAFPTYYNNECFPLVLLEAMCYSLPIISTFEGGIKDMVDEGITGFLIKQKDEQALAYSLEELLTNQGLRMELGNAGRKKYEAEFTLENFSRNFEEILITIISKNNHISEQ